MSKLTEKEYVEVLKSMGASKDNPVRAVDIFKMAAEIYKNNPEKVPESAHTVDRALKRLLDSADEEIGKSCDKKIRIGCKERDGYCLYFKKKGNRITGYWYEKKTGDESSYPLARFLADSVVYSKVLNPEFKPEYYDVLQNIFGRGAVKNKNDFVESIIAMKPYSDDGGIDVMQNVLTIQSAIEKHKKIKFALGVYRYEEREKALVFKTPDDEKKKWCVSPVRVIMSNGRYYLLALSKKMPGGDTLFFRVDLMDEIDILDNERAEYPTSNEWNNPKKFLIANPYFYSGEKKNIVIGFKEEQMTQIVDWFGTEENKVYEIIGSYMFKPDTDGGKKINGVKMIKLRFNAVNVMAFSFWVMQYIENIEVIEGDALKDILRKRMDYALKNRIK